MDAEEFLSHHGVKGMHWGRRKSESSSPRSAKPKKEKPSTQDIKDARARQKNRMPGLQDAEAAYFMSSKKKSDAAAKFLRDKENEYYRGPDAKLADKLTKGEKIATASTAAATAALIASYYTVAYRSTH